MILSQVRNAVLAKGYKWFEDAADKGYDVNIKVVTNLFDDTITISYRDENGVWQFNEWKNTTEPGKKGVQQYHNVNGVARLVPGQYRGVYSIDKHQGKYEALCQRLGAVKVFRDTNKDLVYDEANTDTGMFGINIHKAGQDSTWVENWSEGCQVFKRVKDFDAFMKICKKAAKIHGNHFTYTLIESKDIV
jgi:hypothetical protein